MKIAVVAVALMFTFNAQAATFQRYVNAEAGTGGNGQSWATAYARLTDALTEAQTLIGTSDTVVIWVRGKDDGVGLTYFPTTNTTNRGASFNLPRRTKIYGGFKGDETTAQLNLRSPRRFITTLSGDIDHNDTPNFGNRAGNSYHVVRATSTSFADEIQTSTQLDGFRIVSGNADGSSPDTLGGGLLIELASPVIQNCVFLDNRGMAGGATHVDGEFGQRPPVPEARPKFVSCAFLGNHGVTEAGAMCNQFGEPEFRNCMFSGNTTDGLGGAVYIEGGLGNATLLAINCTFSGNDANGNGGAIYNANVATIQNCILYGNTAAAGSQDLHARNPAGEHH